jgi:hypothetical protein
MSTYVEIRTFVQRHHGFVPKNGRDLQGEVTAMNLRIDGHSPIPVRRQLTEQLKHAIESGGAPPAGQRRLSPRPSNGRTRRRGAMRVAVQGQ